MYIRIYIINCLNRSKIYLYRIFVPILCIHKKVKLLRMRKIQKLKNYNLKEFMIQYSSCMCLKQNSKIYSIVYIAE